MKHYYILTGYRKSDQQLVTKFYRSAEAVANAVNKSVSKFSGRKVTAKYIQETLTAPAMAIIWEDDSKFSFSIGYV